MSSNRNAPVILILSGPSGVGKSTLATALIEADPDTVIAVSHTTRPPRPDEIDGEDYYFASKTKFLELVNNGEMLEYAEVYDNLYGTSQNSLQKSLEQGKNVILDIDWQGARNIKAAYPEAVSVYILPPAEHETEKRLISRQSDSADVIKSRMSSYKEQTSHQHEYDHTIVNDKLPEAVSQLVRIMHFG